MRLVEDVQPKPSEEVNALNNRNQINGRRSKIGDHKVIVIGAGLGGLATAIRLAARGVKVCVLERNQTVGGKVNLHEANGYTFDTGASLLTMPHVFEELFESAHRRLEDYLELVPLDPICRYRWTDGAQFDASSDIERTREQVRRIAPEDVQAFDRFLLDSKRKYEVAARTFLAHSLNDLPRLVRPRYARDLATAASLRTLSAHVEKYFRSAYLRQVFNRFATYNGSSPYRTASTFALIPFVEFGLGAWYVRGGIYNLPRALLQLAIELGVEVRTEMEVEQILIADKKVRGVRLVSGEEIECQTVVANSDAVTTYREMIQPEARRIFNDRRLSKIEPSCSGYVLLLSVRRKYDDLAHHNIFFSSDYPREFRQIFDERRPATEPTIYVCAASRTDATQAPIGHENLFVLVNAPATSDHTDWKMETAGYRDLIFERLESFGFTDLRESIEYEHTITPEDFRTRYRANQGSIYGISSNKIRNLFMRPANRARDIKGLYFAGGATHPGGGMPLVVLSGKMASELVLEDRCQVSGIGFQ